MEEGLVKHDYSTLPDEVWLTILVHLDPRSLLAMEQSSVRFRSIVYDSVVSHKVRCTPNVGIQTLRDFFTGKRLPLIKQLFFDNCFLADPHLIMRCVLLCTNLTYLSCIGCQVKPADILRLITTQPSSLERIEWSLWGSNLCGELIQEILNSARELGLLSRSLRHMYVEVWNLVQLWEVVVVVLNFCSALEDVHIHIADNDHYYSIQAFALIIKDFRSTIRTLTYSQEKITNRQTECPYTVLVGIIQPDIDFKIAASLLGNAAISFQPNRRINCVFLSDLLQQPAAISGFKQLVLAIEDVNSRTADQLAIASRQSCWSVLRSLTLTLVPPSRHCRLPVVGASFSKPLNSLLASCSALAELNLTTFHFSTHVNCSKILATNLPMLQALALAPCGMNYERSLNELFSCCKRLEELDVRVSRDGASGFCKACDLPLRIKTPSMKALQQLKRLSLCYIKQLGSFEFLEACRLVELRILGVSLIDGRSYRNIGHMLCASLCLRSFSYGHTSLNFRSKEFRREIMSAKHLRLLSLYSEQCTDVAVITELIEELTSNMPSLEALHLHYTPMTGTEVPLSWLINERGVWGSTRGVTLADMPCVFCDRTTYIGLARAHNRRGTRFY